MEENYPVHLSMARPERSSRGLAVMSLLLMIPKIVILIPHLIILYALSLASMAVGIVAQFVVLFRGKYPPSMHEFISGTLRWNVRVSAYIFGLIDKYPPYRLKE